VQVEGRAKVFAIADEDLPRENSEKTSAVHFLRFELAPEMIAALKRGDALGMGIDHPQYKAAIPAVRCETRAALVGDLRYP
jgi:glycerol-3-phosphate dehydrogenase subunit C